MEDVKKELEQTNSSEASQTETNANSSELDSDKLKKLELLEQSLVEQKAELEKAKETLKKAEYTIVNLKKTKEVNTENIKEDIKREFEPLLTEIKNLNQLKKENEELKASLTSKEGQINVSGGESVKEDAHRPAPTEEDIKQANRFFNGDMAKWLKYKDKQ